MDRKIINFLRLATAALCCGVRSDFMLPGKFYHQQWNSSDTRNEFVINFYRSFVAIVWLIKHIIQICFSIVFNKTSKDKTDLSFEVSLNAYFYMRVQNLSFEKIRFHFVSSHDIDFSTKTTWKSMLHNLTSKYWWKREKRKASRNSKHGLLLGQYYKNILRRLPCKILN